jgi:hypothetical protein
MSRAVRLGRPASWLGAGIRFEAQSVQQRDADFELLLELLTESIQSRIRA